MIGIPLGILMTVIVFIVFLTALYFIFGQPQCDSLANQTAYSIKIAVDTVSANAFPEWTGSQPPTDSDYAYYSTANIRLCQEQGTTFWESFFGSPPQYQIYYEVFPEGGFTWNEAYPWSGGAAGTLKFWAAMRIGTGVWKLASSAYKKASILGMASETGKAIFGKTRKVLTERQLSEVMEVLAERHGDEAIEAIAKNIKKPGDVLIELHKFYEADEILQTMKNLGYITDDVDNLGRLIISDDPITMLIPVKNADGSIVEEPIFVLRRSDGTIEDAATLERWGGDVAAANADGFKEMKVSPKEIYDNYLNSVSGSERDRLGKLFNPDPNPSLLTKIKDLPGTIKGTAWYQENIQPIIDKVKSYTKRISTAGYDVDFVDANGKPTVSGVEKLFKQEVESGNANGFWYKQIIGDPSLSDKIRKTLKLSSAESITSDHISKYLSMVSDSFNGYVFIPKELKWRLNQIGLNAVELNLKEGTEITSDILKSKIMDIANEPGSDLISKIAGGDAVRFSSMVDDVVDGEIMPSLSSAAGDLTAIRRDTFVAHMENAKTLIESGSEESVKDGMKEVELMIGTIEQNKNVLPVTKKSIVMQGVEANVKKVVYLDVTAIANPGSWYAKGIFASRALEGCEGNSICLLSKNDLESPLYLEASADRFDIKIWRPVAVWQQFAGLQAALMQVPSNPRFYVVSPCFALAKVWKTNYEGTDTIFILPEKVETNGSSNYCYADSDLINQYTAIWAISDILDFMPWSSFLGFLKIPAKAVSVVDSVVGIADPATLLQGILEGAISWPGSPWTPLNYQGMIDAQQNVPKVLSR